MKDCAPLQSKYSHAQCRASSFAESHLALTPTRHIATARTRTRDVSAITHTVARAHRTCSGLAGHAAVILRAHAARSSLIS